MLLDITKHLDIVFLVYGLAFIIMGVCIFVYPRKKSIFTLSDILWLLALFGVVHGLNEWFDMFSLTRRFRSNAFDWIRWMFLYTSYIFLFEFGRRLILLSYKKAFNKWITISLSIITIIFTFALTHERSIWPRYLLGFPGGIITAVGLIAYYNHNDAILAPLQIRRYFIIAAFSIGIYGILGGIIVPQADFFPASVINQTEFLNLFRIPVQLFRTICSIIIAWAVWNILGIFSWEVRKKLEENYNKLKKLEEIKDSLTQMIVHDLRNPLGIALQDVQFLQSSLRNSLSEQDKDVFLNSFGKLREMKNMISDLLDIGKMEESKLTLKYEPIDIAVLIKEVINDMKVLSEDKEISAKIPSEISRLSADKEILKRVISNLIGNALKFTPSGSKIDVMVNDDKKDKNVIISVQDQGEGVPEEYKDKIFDKFAQVQSREARKSGGKGLGLAFCKMAVEAHGGKIWVENEIGKGSIFYFAIPTKQ
ncbi:MAG: ATP-binding protein [Candidatus Omnitrophota bacterium]